MEDYLHHYREFSDIQDHHPRALRELESWWTGPVAGDLAAGDRAEVKHR
jgi:hypothetical protein